MKKNTILLVVLSLLSNFLSSAPKPDEGMWLPMFFKDLNYSTMQKMGLKLTAEQLYDINNSSLKDAIVQFGNGCTGEIVSDKGLLFTNHHCGYEAIAGQSTVEHDYLGNGFWAKDLSEEIPIPDMTVSFLLRMEDVTKIILGDYDDRLDLSSVSDTILVRIKELEDKTSEQGKYKVVVKPFFEGLEYYMFVYEVFTDIRLVGTPPSSIGKYGGDTDNWMWPRHTGDFSIFRVYANSENKPAKFSKDNVPFKPKHFLPISLKGVKQSDFVMIWGFPGSTERYMTSGEVANTINVTDPSIVKGGEFMLPTMKKMMDKDNRVNLIYASDYAGYMNLWKNKKGELRGLKNLNVYGKKKAIEDRLVNWISEDKTRIDKYGDVIKDLNNANKTIGNAPSTQNEWFVNFGLLTNKRALFAFQATYSILPLNKKDTNYSRVIASVKARGDEHFKTYDQETEKELFKAFINMFSTLDKNSYISNTLQKKYKGNIDEYVDDAFKKSIFGNKENFNKFINKPNSKKLEKDIIVKSVLTAYSYVGGEDNKLQEAYENLAQARKRFVAALREMDNSLVQYPDANFTMRMTYGQVLDYYPADGIHYDFKTTLEGVMEKEDPSSTEFQVPAKLKELFQNKDYGQYADENGKIITCFLSNNDITGGNSGSPILNAEGHLIGLAFDGNWEAMSGDIAFEPKLQRTINVDARYVLFIIDKFAGAKNIIDELTIIK
ncbi:MAG: S46 family peptidase [Bacteroidales bacterium]|jgi:hypothetical protein|nr:S46 family peptidase [Bacteroidales bacterium]MDD4703472.1 S46 family peptidase [Bacteroidales bacterium]MDX9797514.1 S46 family peptidase [Bacteroidales bacterium]